MKALADTIFSFGLGSFLITAAVHDVAVPDFLMWGVTILILISAYVSIKGFGAHATFWTFALDNLDTYGPKGERHETALEMHDISKAIVEPYSGPAKFFLSFAGSLMVLAGLMMQGWYLPLIAEAASSALGYGFIHYFQVNKMVILGQITGADEAA